MVISDEVILKDKLKVASVCRCFLPGGRL